MSSPYKTRSQGPVDSVIQAPVQGTQPSSTLNIEDELVFYGSYHATKGNKIIHFICIPQIAWSTLVLLSHFSLPGSSIHVWPFGLAYQPSVALILMAAYQLYYIFLEPIGGLTFLPWSVHMYLTATYTYHFPPTWAPYSSPSHPTAIPFAWLVFTAAWIGQFIGHGVFEHRAPALKDNLVQALVTAPFFVHLEMMFGVFGYKPELARRVKNKVGVRVRDFRKASKKAQ